MKFKQFEAEPEANWFKAKLRNPHTRKTLIYVLLGALAGFLLFYITDGRKQDVMETRDIVNNLLIGGLFGLFITNSPCARNKC